MAEELTKKEKGFVKDYIDTGNGTQAALNNYDTESENTAAVIAYDNLRKPKIQNAIKSIAEQIPDELLVEKHLALLNKEEVIYKNNNATKKIEAVGRDIDAQAVGKGLEMAYRLKGSYAPEKTQTLSVTVNLDEKSLEIAKKYEEELKKNL